MSCNITFTNDEDAYTLYQSLKSQGMKCGDLDIGYHKIDFSSPKPNEKLVGAKDNKVEERELIEYVTERYKKYQNLIEGYTHYPLGWVLDDQNLSTSFDEKLRERVNQAVGKLKIHLMMKEGLSENSPQYKEKLAVGLYYFAFLPEHMPQSKEAQSKIMELISELQEQGLGEFQKFLMESGGLGLSLIETDAPIEASALETLAAGKGWCTEQSKVLYAVFEMAGLKPEFVYVNGRDFLKVWKERGKKFTPDIMGQSHVALRIDFGEHDRVFDISNWQSNMVYPHYYPLRLSHFLAFEMSNKVSRGIFQIDSHSQVEPVLKRAARLSPESGSLLSNLGVLYTTAKKHDLAIETLKRADQVEPDQPMIVFNLGGAFAAKGNHQQAVESFRKAVGMFDHAPAYYDLGASLLALGKVGEAEPMARKAIEIDEKLGPAHSLLALILLRKGRFDEAVNEYETAKKLGEKSAMLLMTYGIALAHINRIDESISQFEKAGLSIENALTGENELATADRLMEQLQERLALLSPEMKKNKDLMKPLVDIYNRIAQSYDHLHSFKKAEMVYRKALQLDPSSEKALWNLYQVLKSANKNREAVRVCLDYKRVARTDAVACE